MSAEVRERFARIVNDPEEQLDLAEAALLIAKEEQPDLDIEAYLRRLKASTMATPQPANPSVPGSGIETTTLSKKNRVETLWEPL